MGTVSFWKDEGVLRWVVVMVAQQCNRTWHHCAVQLKGAKMVHFTFILP